MAAEKTIKRDPAKREQGAPIVIAGILPLQIELEQFLSFFNDIIVVALEDFERQTELIADQMRAVRNILTLDQRLEVGNALGDYVRARRALTADLARLAGAKRAIAALRDLIDIESDDETLRQFHSFKIELLLYAFALLRDVLRALIRMSAHLRRAMLVLPW